MRSSGRDGRTAALQRVLEHAERDPYGGLPFDTVPEAQVAFGSRGELVLALQQAWSQALWSRIETHATRYRGDRSLLRTLTALAWSDCAEQHPVLRRLLDTCGDGVGPLPELAIA